MTLGEDRSVRAREELAPAPGIVLGSRYKVERLLGRGGMSTVVCARDQRLGHLVALKLLRRVEHEQSADTARFLREARIIAQLQSDYVVRVFDVDIESEPPYLAMELLEGHTIATLLAERGRLSVEVALQVMGQACRGVADAHPFGVLHRDLKPSNLFVARAPDGTPRVKVIDFGISRPLAGDLATLTARGQVVGSPRYMAPEQLEVDGVVDERSDIWSLGVTLYEVLAGVSPFEAPTVLETFSRIARDRPVPLQARVPAVPGRLASLVELCLAKHPALRPPTVRALLEELDALMPPGPLRISLPIDAPATSLTASTDATPWSGPGGLPAMSAGAVFGRYELAERLGSGAVGDVYRAYDTILHRHVALKLLLAGRGAGDKASSGAESILREARAAAGITHPNAISIYDVGEVAGVPFLAMELVPGRTLRARISDDTARMGRRVRWLVDVARALGAAHQRALIHRDIKPENVMVSEEGVVKVLDFGIARRAAPDEKEGLHGAAPITAALSNLQATNGTWTVDGVVVGTPMYMSPEQMRGERLDGRSDQFSWGVLAYEVLTRTLPWGGATAGLAVLNDILTAEAAPLGGVLPEIPEVVDSVVRRALSKRAADRFSTMEEIAEALEPFAVSIGGGGGESGEQARTQPGAVKARGAGAFSARLKSLVVAVALSSIALGGIAIVKRRHAAAALPTKEPALAPAPDEDEGDPSLAISGVVIDTNGAPAPNANVSVVAGDVTSDARTDRAGGFTVHAFVAGEALLYAYKKGKSARIRGTFSPDRCVTLNLVEPGKIEGTFDAPDASGEFFSWGTPGGVPYILPGFWNLSADLVGSHFTFESVPAGDVEVHVGWAESKSVARMVHALVHVEPGRTATLTLPSTSPANASVAGKVLSSVTHKAPALGAVSLLLPNDSAEATSTTDGADFAFTLRSPGNRVLLFVAEGYKPRRVPVLLEPNKETDLGKILLEPLLTPAKPTP